MNKKQQQEALEKERKTFKEYYDHENNKDQ